MGDPTPQAEDPMPLPQEIPDWASLVVAARDWRYSDEFVGIAFRNRLHRADRGDR